MTTIATDRTEELSARLFEAATATLEMFTIHLGRRLGLYELLSDGEARTVAEVAAQAGIAERYAREWLEQQAVAGFLDVDDASAPEHQRRYRLAPDQALVLHEPESAALVAPLASMVAGIGQALPQVVQAFRTGDGVPYAAYGRDFREGQASANRPLFANELAGQWLASVPDVHERLLAGARIGDVGCGLGWSTQALARAYPASTVVGIDADAGSIVDAKGLLPSDLADRVTFVNAEAAKASAYGPFDLVLIVEALHDMADPAEALAGIRAALDEGGVVLIADERVAESFTAPGDDIERVMYGWSVTACLPAALAEGGEAIGTVIRPSAVEDVARRAGFTRCEVLPVEHDIFRLYRLEG